MAAPDLIDSRDEDGFTPLHLAVIAGNMPLVTFLLANDADVNAVDNEKHTAVHWATVCGETAALRAVLAAGAPVSTPDVHGGYPLHYAAQMCGGERDSNLGLQVLQTLLTHSDIVVSVEDGDGRQPLLWAASAGSAKALLALIRAGAAVEASDKDGLTALHCAASRGHTDCIDTLLTLCGASPDVIDSNGCTALHYAVTLGHADATALLLAHGADCNRQDRKGRSPAHCGCAKGQFETVKMIGTHGANLWLRNARGDLPLHEAAASGRRELVKWLLEMRPSQVNARNNDGRCPLHLAALNDNSDMCKILLDAGAQINPVLRTSKNTFMTPLDCALQRGFRSTAKYLQLHGGVPANRLKDARRGKQDHNVNLQIRDDITFWGDTSTDSERENGEVDKINRKIQRKKLSHKYEKKKRASLSGSDLETHRKLKNHLDTGRNNNKKLMEKSRKGKLSATSTKSDSMNSSFENSKTRNRFDYKNEIIINGKTEINIHQTKQITINKDATKEETENAKESIVKNEVISEKEKRPKSAKHNKVRDKSGKSRKGSSTTTTKPVNSSADRSELERKISKEKEANLKLIKDEVNELKKTKNIEKSVDKNLKDLNEKKPVDYQSIISNTSEDIEEHKRITVEAAVHEPPKDFTSEKLEEMEKMKEKIQHKLNGDERPIQSTFDENKADVIQKDIIIKKEFEEIENKSKDPPLEEDTADIGKVSQIKKQSIKTVVDSSSQTVSEELKEIAKIIEEVATIKEDTLEKNVEESKQGEIFQVDVTENLEAIQKQNKDTVVENDEKLEEKSKDKLEIDVQNEKDVEITSTEKSKDLENIQIEHNEKKELEVGNDQNIEEVVAQKQEDRPQVEHEIKSEIINKERDKNSKELKKTTDEQQCTKIETSQDKQLTAEEHEDTKSENNDPKRRKQIGDNEINGVQDFSKSNNEAPTEEQVVTIKEDETFQSEKEKIKKRKSHRKKWDKKKAYEIIETTIDGVAQNKEQKSDEEYSTSEKYTNSSSTSSSLQEHKSFRILDNNNETKRDDTKRSSSRHHKTNLKKQRSRSEDGSSKHDEKIRKSRIPTPVIKSTISRNDKYLEVPAGGGRKTKSSLESRVPSLPNIHENRERIKEQPPPPPPPRSESNMSAPLLATAIYSDNEEVHVSGSDLDENDDDDNEKNKQPIVMRKKLVKRRSKTRDTHSAGSDYESSHIIDSGFEPSPRSSRIPKWRNMTERGVNMTSVTQTIQSNIRRYHLERKIFQHLLELKRSQIRAGQHNEAILVKRAIDAYHQSCASTVGAGRYIPEDYTFKSFEKFLYLALRKLQRNGADYLKGLPETPVNPLLCTKSTNRCMHAAHAYTGIPCAAYLPMMDHHSIPKIGFTTSDCKPGTAGFLPNINQKKAVTLELCHGSDKQVISLPADRLDQNKRYYVTFTVKGNEEKNQDDQITTGHTHPKSD